MEGLTGPEYVPTREYVDKGKKDVERNMWKQVDRLEGKIGEITPTIGNGGVGFFIYYQPTSPHTAYQTYSGFRDIDR